jgi:hypothetical protein
MEREFAGRSERPSRPGPEQRKADAGKAAREGDEQLRRSREAVKRSRETLRRLEDLLRSNKSR